MNLEILYHLYLPRVLRWLSTDFAQRIFQVCVKSLVNDVTGISPFLIPLHRKDLRASIRYPKMSTDKTRKCHLIQKDFLGKVLIRQYSKSYYCLFISHLESLGNHSTTKDPRCSSFFFTFILKEWNLICKPSDKNERLSKTLTLRVKKVKETLMVLGNIFREKIFHFCSSTTNSGMYNEGKHFDSSTTCHVTTAEPNISRICLLLLRAHKSKKCYWMATTWHCDW